MNRDTREAFLLVAGAWQRCMGNIVTSLISWTNVDIHIQSIRFFYYLLAPLNVRTKCKQARLCKVLISKARTSVVGTFYFGENAETVMRRLRRREGKQLQRRRD
jgi:predicted N-acetyltransferase YhbS